MEVGENVARISFDTTANRIKRETVSRIKDIQHFKEYGNLNGLQH